MVSPNVLKRFLSTIAIPTVNLNSSICCLATQSVSPIVTHANLLAQALLNLHMLHAIHFRSSLTNQKPEHGGLGCELYERELNALIMGERLSEGLSIVGVGDGLVDAEDRCAERGGCLTDAIFMNESLSYGKAFVEWADDGGGGNPDVCQGDGGVIGRHIQSPAQSDVRELSACVDEMRTYHS